MSFLRALDIAGSGVTAQKQRIDVITENITNKDTTRTAQGGPYRRKLSVFQERAGGVTNQTPFKKEWVQSEGSSFESVLSRARAKQAPGVQVVEIIEDESALVPRYDPTHPDADENGYVMMPNVDNTEEMIDLIAASRSYDANVTAFNSIKAMAVKALEIGK